MQPLQQLWLLGSFLSLGFLLCIKKPNNSPLKSCGADRVRLTKQTLHTVPGTK